MKRMRWHIPVILSLVALSAVLYYVEYQIFRDAREVWIWVVSSLAFVPLQVALVTLVMEQLLAAQEKQAKLHKLNMVIGAFFSEVGVQLLRSFSELDPDMDTIRRELVAVGTGTRQQLQSVEQRLHSRSYRFRVDREAVETLSASLLAKRDFLLRMLENPNLLEHDRFSELLWAVFHLTEELGYRQDVASLPDADCRHLSTDVERAYVLLTGEWLAYMQHLRADYPYLFSLAMRTNPFDLHPSVQIQTQPDGPSCVV